MQQNLTIYRGADNPSEIQLIDESTNKFFDLTNATEIEACFKNEDGSLNTKLKTTSGIVVVDALSGQLKIVWSEVETLLLRVGQNLSFFIKVTINGTDTWAVPFNNVLFVEDLKCG